MGKQAVKAGTKLDLTAQVDGEDVALKSSFVKESGGKWQLSMPMSAGKSFSLEKGTPLSISWSVDGTVYSVEARADGTVKQGVRSYLLAVPEEEVQREERRAHVRIPAEIDVEITSYETASDGSRRPRVYPGRTTDISNGGIAVFTNAPMAVGETIDVAIARKGTKKLPLRAGVCWIRPAPKVSGYRDFAGLQFFFLNSDEGLAVAKLTASLAGKQK